MSRMFENIIYKKRGNLGLGLTLHLPECAPKDGAPLVVFIHGGGFTSGKRFKIFPERLGQILSANIACASISYSLVGSGANTVCDCAVDCFDAARFLAKNAKTLGLNSGKTAFYGRSAGGLLALLCATANSSDFLGSPELRGFNFTPKCVCAVSAVCDFLSFKNASPTLVESLFGKNATMESDVVKKLSPSEYINKNMPEVLLVHGTADTTVPIDCAVRYYQKASKLSSKISFMQMPNGGHKLECPNTVFASEFAKTQFAAELEMYKRNLL